ncbi:hypothetical protein IAR55_005149 [Kwoniella newhampshirensis]|uniref:DUF803-domain-containing protein n=1 Tax=Kwoniella newhampshirensis TaxID=1651941 RepID=A0AAW0YWQ4_9TREE
MVYSAIGSVSTSSLIGVGIACGGNVLISLALTIQKLAHRRNEELVQARYQSLQTEEDDQEEHNGDEDCALGEGRVLGAPPPIPEEEEDGKASVTDSGGNATINATPSSPSPGQKPSFSTQAVASTSPKDQADSISSSEQRREGETSQIQTLTAVPVRLVPERTKSGKSQIALQVDSPSSPHPDRFPSSNRSNQHAQNGIDITDSEEDDKEHAAQHSAEVEEGMYLKSKLWWMGMVLIAIGEGGNFLSYGFAPASVVAPLGTVALIANCVFAPLILREQFHKKELLGMGLAIVGAVTVVWSSNSANPRLDPPQLLVALTRLPFLIYTLLNILLLALCLFLSTTSHGHRYICIDVGICALFGGYTVLATKALSSLLSNDFFGAWRWGITWGMVAVVGVTSLGQIRWLNRALMRFQSKEVIPTQFVFFSLAAIIGSAVLYQEFRDVPFSHFVNFAFGIATTFLGVYLLTSSQSSAEEAINDNDADQASPTTSSVPTLPRASSSRSINLLLPTAVSTANERTPLVPTPSISVRRSSATPSSSNTFFSPPTSGGSIPRPIGSKGSVSAALPPGSSLTRVKLSKRTSTSDFSTPTLGLGSQAGFLLMATTPPGTGFQGRPGPGPGSGPGGRTRSSSRGQPYGYGWDEESGRRNSGMPR